MAVALPAENGFGNFGNFFAGMGEKVHTPAEDSDWIAGLTFKVHEPTLLHVSSEGSRLIKKVTAYRDGAEFWTQAFYRSSGSNSKYPGIWFPFLGIVDYGRKKGYYAKDVSVPYGWPAEDKLSHRFARGLNTHVPDSTHELVQRFVTRSFVLGSSAISAIRPEAGEREGIMGELFDISLHGEKVDPKIAGLVIANGDYNDFKDEYKSLPVSSSKEVNDFIGKDIYINYGKNAPLNLSGRNSLPNYNKNIMGMHGGRRTRRRSNKPRIMRRKASRKRSTRRRV